MVNIYGPLVYQWCRQRGLDQADSADVLQEVLWAVNAKLADFRLMQRGDSFRGWLWMITRNKIHDHYRRMASRLRAAGGSAAYAHLQQLAEMPEEEPVVSSNDDGGVVRRALDAIRVEFTASTWQAFWRCTIDGLSAAEVAAEVGTNSHAIRQAKYRVMSRLRQELHGLEPPGLE